MDNKYLDAYYERACLLNGNNYTKNYSAAILDLNKIIEINPKYKDGAAYYQRGFSYLQLNKKDSSCLDYSKAGELGFKYAYTAIEKYCEY